MIPLDLRPYGIDETLVETSKQADFSTYSLRPGKHYEDSTKTVRLVILDGVRYPVSENLGSGTFGTTYKARAPDGTEVAIKIVKSLTTDKKKANFISECIMQIVMAEASKAETDGPYVPTVYKIGFNSTYHFGYLCSELMRNTLNGLIKSYGPAENDVVIPDALQKISRVLSFFYDKLKFNHRDMKTDNIMYVRKGADRIFKLIDFGYSCLTLPTKAGPIQIRGGDYFEETSTCFKQDRDLSQLLYAILQSPRLLSSELQKRFSEMLLANVKRHTCRMVDGCPKDKLKKWEDVYDFLDRKNVHVPFGSPARVQEQMTQFVTGRPFDRANLKIKVKGTAKPKPCPPGTTKHPRTGRCVKDGGIAWLSFNPFGEIPCPEGKERNPLTRRCIKKCPPGTRRVEGTRRCVKQKLNPVEPPSPPPAPLP